MEVLKKIGCGFACTCTVMGGTWELLEGNFGFGSLSTSLFSCLI